MPARQPVNVVRRYNVGVSGHGNRPMLFAHGFGCDRNMWRFIVPAFEDTHRVVVFDHVGVGLSDLGAYDRQKYSTVDRYADDVVDIGHSLHLDDVMFVGHSVSAMIELSKAESSSFALVEGAVVSRGSRSRRRAHIRGGRAREGRDASFLDQGNGPDRVSRGPGGAVES